MMYAYPQADVDYHPNCGPGKKTWCCITIMDNVEMRANFDMAMEPSQLHVAFSKRYVYVTFLYHAQAGGDPLVETVARIMLTIFSAAVLFWPDTWKCTRWYHQLRPTARDFSIQCGCGDLPAIAYQESSEIYANLRVFRVTSPAVGAMWRLKMAGPGRATRVVKLLLRWTKMVWALSDLLKDVPYEENVKIADQFARFIDANCSALSISIKIIW